MFCKLRSFVEADKKYFAECKDNIMARNSGMLRKSCIVYAFVLCFYTAFTIITNQPRLLRTMYYVFGAIHICLCAVIYVSDKLKKRNDLATQIYCACLEVSILSFFALEGVFVDRTQHSLYIPIAILLVLLVFIHGAVYTRALINLYVLSFAVLSLLYKTPEAYTHDIYIAIATLISANIGYVLIAQMRHSEGAVLTKYEKLSQTDPLTGVSNKVSIMQKCEQILLDTGRACAFIMIDLDDFKGANDRYGHDVGDAVLQAVSRAIEASFRGTDFIGRFGGDEFIIIMDNCNDVETIKYRVEKLLGSIQALAFPQDGLKVRCSAGITLKHENDTIQTIFKRADTALYQAKNNEKGHYRIIE